MSDENTGAIAPQAPASSAEQSIPKVRFDEVLNQKRMLEEQTRFQQQMLLQMQQRNQPPQMPSQEQQRLARLREDNPEAYKAEVEKLRLRQEIASTKQAIAGLWDEQDKANLERKYPKSAKRAQEVEQTIEQFRQAGNYNVSREQVYMWMLGQEKLKEEMGQAPTIQAMPTQANIAPTPTTVDNDDVPPTDARYASSLQAGKASSGASNKSQAEIEKELDLIEF